MKIPNIPSIDLSYASKTEYQNSGLINSSVNQTWQYFENSGAMGLAIFCVILIILFLVSVAQEREVRAIVQVLRYHERKLHHLHSRAESRRQSR